jgi:MFS family permease
MASSIGMALGPLAGGWVFDTFNSYSWLYIGSLSVGLGAVAMALLFPPQPSRMRELPQPA